MNFSLKFKLLYLVRTQSSFWNIFILTGIFLMLCYLRFLTLSYSLFNIYFSSFFCFLPLPQGRDLWQYMIVPKVFKLLWKIIHNAQQSLQWWRGMDHLILIPVFLLEKPILLLNEKEVIWEFSLIKWGRCNHGRNLINLQYEFHKERLVLKFRGRSLTSLLLYYFPVNLYGRFIVANIIWRFHVFPWLHVLLLSRSTLQLKFAHVTQTSYMFDLGLKKISRLSNLSWRCTMRPSYKKCGPMGIS